MYNENISGLIPLNRDVIVYYELKTQKIEHDFELEREELVKKCKDQAYKELPVGEILRDNSTTTIVDNSMFAITTIEVYGEIA